MPANTDRDFSVKQLSDFVVAKQTDLSYAQNQAAKNQSDFYSYIIGGVANDFSTLSCPDTTKKSDWNTVIDELVRNIKSKVYELSYWLRENNSKNSLNTSYKNRQDIYNNWITNLKMTLIK